MDKQNNDPIINEGLSLKNLIQDLAIFGEKPAFMRQLHVGRPNIGNRQAFMERVDAIFDNRWFSNNGPYVQQLETKLAEYLKVKHCILLTNGTIGLEIAVRALELSGEVIIPSFTFIATAHALQWQEITPVFCDVAPDSHHIDPTEIERHITPRTSAILGVHVWGNACDVDAIAELAQKHNLKVLYDAAHAFGCSHQGQMIGNFGELEVFSFHATKFFNTFEGGAITTNNDELANKIRFMRNFGFADYDDVQYLGINGKMTEISAAMGLSVLDTIDDIIVTNKQNYERYKDNLKNIAGIKLYNYDLDSEHNYQYVILEIDDSITGINRDALTQILHAENILARRYFYPGCHMMEPYRSYFPHASLLLPNTIQLTERVMSLPNGTAVSLEDIDTICNLIKFCVEHGNDISTRLISEFES